MLQEKTNKNKAEASCCGNSAMSEAASAADFHPQDRDVPYREVLGEPHALTFHPHWM